MPYGVDIEYIQCGCKNISKRCTTWNDINITMVTCTVNLILI
jgi:hypothetical protein